MEKSYIFAMVFEGLAPAILGLIYVFKIRKYELNLPSPILETKPCPNFVPPPTKKKIICQEDLEYLKCKNCGAPLNKDLKCEYCGTQWFDKTN